MRQHVTFTALLVVLCCAARAAFIGFSTDFEQAKATSKATGKLIFAYFDLGGCPGCAKIHDICLSKPAFLSIGSAYVLLQLDAYDYEALADQHGVTQFPNFAVLDADGRVKVPTGTAIGEILFNKPPLECADVLLNLHYRLWAEAKKVPPSAEVVIAQLELLRAYSEVEAYDGLLRDALANPDAAPEEIACLRVYHGLDLRREGELEEGLQLISRAGSGLRFAEADEGASAPFTISRGETLLATVGSDADARLLADALRWLGRAEGDLASPPEAGASADELAQGATALAVLGRTAEAEIWLTAYKAATEGKAPADRMSSVLADGLCLRAGGQHAKAAQRLAVVVRYAPWESYAQWAGTLATEAARAAGDRQAEQHYAQLTADTFGSRLRRDLRVRIERPHDSEEEAP